jgi:hypothetical protein
VKDRFPRISTFLGTTIDAIEEHENASLEMT